MRSEVTAVLLGRHQMQLSEMMVLASRSYRSSCKFSYLEYIESIET